MCSSDLFPSHDTAGVGDTISYAYTSNVTRIDLQNQTATVSASDTDQIKNFENVIGGSGDDTIVLKAGVGGAKGNVVNNIDGGVSGSDTVSYENYSAALTINLASGTEETGDKDILTSIENVIGGSGKV